MRILEISEVWETVLFFQKDMVGSLSVKVVDQPL